MIAPAVFAFGLVAFGFLGMGPVTIAVDSYGPVTDNAQSIYELSTIEQIPGIKEELKKSYGYTVDFERAKLLLEENDGAGNTFKATAKPVLIGTAVTGATTMIFSIIVLLTERLRPDLVANLSVLHPEFLLGLITGGAVIYWFTGASTQAVTTGAYRAVEFIKKNIKLEGVTKASVTDSKKVVEICTRYAQRGMFNIFLGVFFGTLAFAFFEPYFFVGYLISIAIFGLFQAIFMANAGAAWDNAKKIVETELQREGDTDLHAATVVGDTVGDPFKDTSSVAMNPVIKFTTLFGLLAVELAVSLAGQQGRGITFFFSAVFFAVSIVLRVAVFLQDANRNGIAGEIASRRRWERRGWVENRPGALDCPTRPGRLFFAGRREARAHLQFRTADRLLAVLLLGSHEAPQVVEVEERGGSRDRTRRASRPFRETRPRDPGPRRRA